MVKFNIKFNALSKLPVPSGRAPTRGAVLNALVRPPDDDIFLVAARRDVIVAATWSLRWSVCVGPFKSILRN